MKQLQLRLRHEVRDHELGHCEEKRKKKNQSPERVDAEDLGRAVFVEAVERHVASDGSGVRKEEIEAALLLDRAFTDLLDQLRVGRVSVKVGDLSQRPMGQSMRHG